MATGIEVTKKEFFSNYHSLYDKDESLVIEDCQFDVFTNLIEESGVFDNSPIVSRNKGSFGASNWAILGYSSASERLYDEEDDDDDEDDDQIQREKKFMWRYSIINGFFSNSIEVVNATKPELTKSVNQAINFIKKTIKKDYIKDINETQNLQSEIINKIETNSFEKIDVYIITDKLIIQDDLIEQIVLESDLRINIYYWDLKRWNDLKRSKSKRLPITIDFTDHPYNCYNIDFVKKIVDKSLSQYLAIFPADLIADLYDRYRTSLLENNVRVFLSAKRKANFAIRNTLKSEDSKLFFSFNNGLSATVDKIDIKDNKIIKIHDFQVVNGGQTTASIHYARERDRKKDGNRVSLENVFVPVKITEIVKSKNENYGEIVSNISKAANTQSAIKQSDFYANDLFLVEIERFTQKHSVSDKYGKNKFYFFERMSGQFNVIKNSQGKPGSKNVKIWENEHPKDFKFTKIELARWHNCLHEYPHIAASGAESQFESFMKNKNFDKGGINLGKFKNIVGFGMVFNRIRKLVGTKTGKEYPSIIGDSSVGMSTTIYASSILNKLFNGKIDYWAIFNHEYKICQSLINKKRIESEIDSTLIIVIKETWKQLEAFGKTSVQEQTKKLDCWEFFKRNFKLNDSVKKQFDKFLITDFEKEKRVSDDINEEDLSYFEGLNLLCSENCKILSNLLIISKRESDYRDLKSTIQNTITKVEKKEFIITKKRVKQIYSFYKKANKKGYKLDHLNADALELNIDFMEIFNLIFKDYNNFIKSLSNEIYETDMSEENLLIYDSIKNMKEKLEREHGLSINDFIRLKRNIKDLKTKKLINI